LRPLYIRDERVKEDLVVDRGSLRTVLRLLQRFQGEESGSASDAELLRRFIDLREESAFEVLVRRHGQAVLNLCRRVLGHAHDAEDAFQATFLLLVLKGGTVRKQTSLGSWLYKVALRVALAARGRAAVRAVRERHDLEFPPDEPGDTAGDKELRDLLHEEVNRLPELYRWPVVLCYLSGQSTAEAAQALGCPRGTVLSRLATARQRLLRRLLQRGVTLSAAGLLPAVGQQALKASSALVGLTVKAAARVAAGKVGTAGVAGSVVTLMEGVLNAMYWTKIKTTAAAVLLVAALAFGLGLWSRQTATAEGRPERKEEQTAGKPAEEGKRELKRIEMERPFGTWEQNIEGKFRIRLRFEADHLFLKAVVQEDKERFTLLGEADFSVTKDAVLFGVITGVDIVEDADSSLDLQQLLDNAFSLRYRVDGDVLTIKDVKFAPAVKEGNLGEDAKILPGRYKRVKDGDKEDSVPERRTSGKKRSAGGTSSQAGGLSFQAGGLPSQVGGPPFQVGGPSSH
jgi:RNA polymerase sigma factor (sigma-70 family)